MLPSKNYTAILVAFDDVNGVSVDSEYITDHRLEEFLKNGKTIHYEKMFLSDKKPARVVYWGKSGDEWLERSEILL